jgi:hypothetical protein
MTMKTKTKKKAAPRKKRSAAPKSGMTGYLVIWRHTMDDIPVRLFADQKVAFKVAKTMSRRAAATTAMRIGFEVSTPVCFIIVQFENGKAVDFYNVDREDDYC